MSSKGQITKMNIITIQRVFRVGYARALQMKNEAIDKAKKSKEIKQWKKE